VEAALGAAVGAVGGATIGARPVVGAGADIYSLQKKSFERTRILVSINKCRPKFRITDKVIKSKVSQLHLTRFCLIKCI
jgi:hypothetical protein